jgi:ElaB/YqjD/DUF883 family membrane-anchored ribosome-binding protein
MAAGDYMKRFETILRAHSRMAASNAESIRNSGAAGAEDAARQLQQRAWHTDVENALRNLAAQVDQLLAASGLDAKEQDTIAPDDRDAGTD